MLINPTQSPNVNVSALSYGSGAPNGALPNTNPTSVPSLMSAQLGAEGASTSNFSLTTLLVVTLQTLTQVVNTLANLVARLFGGGFGAADSVAQENTKPGSVNVNSLLANAFDPIKELVSRATSGITGQGGLFGDILGSALDIFGGGKIGSVVGKVGKAISKIF